MLTSNISPQSTSDRISQPLQSVLASLHWAEMPTSAALGFCRRVADLCTHFLGTTLLPRVYAARAALDRLALVPVVEQMHNRVLGRRRSRCKVDVISYLNCNRNHSQLISGC